MGIEPTLFAWEARVLPLNDTRAGFDYRGLNCNNFKRHEGVAAGPTVSPAPGLAAHEVHHASGPLACAGGDIVFAHLGVAYGIAAGQHFDTCLAGLAYA